MDKLEILADLKLKNKFPEESWYERHLNPSSGEVILKMNEELNKFIDFIKKIIAKPPVDELIAPIQSYFDNRDLYNFDTEEREFIVDKMFEVLDMMEIKSDNIFI